MHFASDNAGIVAPEALAAIARANEGHALAYGKDAATKAVEAELREVFEAPEARVFLVTSGTAANSLALGTLTRPWEAVFCHEEAHINVSECNAPEFYTGGAKLVPLPGAHGCIDPEALSRAMDFWSTDPEPDTRRGPLSVTQVNELGGVYALEELRALTGIAKARGSLCHLDGARFANALVALGCTPAEMTWKAGFDAVSFGGTKNGLLAAEAVIFFDPKFAYDFEHKRRRGAHLLSKQRYIAAQYKAYLDGGLWLDMAARANRAAAALLEGLRAVDGVEIENRVDANMIYANWPRWLHRKVRDQGAAYYVYGGDPYANADPEERLTARLVTNWATTAEEIDALVGLLKAG
jgi:threonine aldolase